MAALSDTARELFSRPIHGWATVTRPDGTPHNSVVWVDVDGDDLIFNTATGRAKERFIAASPVVSLSVLDPDNDHRWASVSGPASVSEHDGDEVIDRLAKKYLGADSYPYRKPAEQRVTVRVKVQHLTEETGR